MKRTLLMLISVCWLSSANAENVWFSSELKSYYPLSNGELVLTFNDASPNCSSTGDYHRIKVGENTVTQEGFDLMAAAALAGGASGKRVNIFFDNSTEYCYINRLSVTFIE